MSAEIERLTGGQHRVRRYESFAKSRGARRKLGLKSRSLSRSRSRTKDKGRNGLLTVAAYLYKKTGRSWFVGPRGIYLSVPAGVNAHPAAMQLVADIPEVRGLAIYSPAQNQIYIPAQAARTLAARLTMRDQTIKQYCQKIGAPHEQRFFGKPYACDPWLAQQMARGRLGGANPYPISYSNPLQIASGGAPCFVV